jgi:hypothetical protein
MHFDIIKVFYLPTDAQEFCFKRNIKIYVKNALTECYNIKFSHHHHHVRKGGLGVLPVP